MRNELLLDTHAFIWWASTSARLPAQVLTLCEDTTNDLLLSVVSVWEMQVKIQLGKMTASRPLRELVAHHQQANNLHVLPVQLEHVLALDTLPLQHKDPFDRLLIAQANVEDAFLVSGDKVFASYSVKLLW